MTLAAGTTLGPYEIVAPLGAGGMGEVYRARDTRLGREVAIKVLPVHLSSNPEVRSRFEREARTISSLNHPHICTLFDVGREGDTDYLVMELVDGETLAWQISTEGGGSPLWSRGGHELFYVSGTKMMTVPVETEPAFRAGTPALLFEGGFSVTRPRDFDVGPDGRFVALHRAGTASQRELRLLVNWEQAAARTVAAAH